MPLWDSLTNKTNPTSLAFNKMLNDKTLDAISRRNGLMYLILGKPNPMGRDEKSESLSFEKLTKTNGIRHSVRLMGAKATPTYPASISAEIATATGQHDNAIWGELEFSLAHGVLKWNVPHSELNTVSGDTVKGASLLEEYAQFFSTSLYTHLSEQILSANAPALTTIGGIVYAVDDGASQYGPAYINDDATGGNASYKMYGLLDRSIQQNAFTCPYVGASVGVLSIQAVQRAVNFAASAGGDVQIAPAGPELYGKAQDLARTYVQVSYDKKWDRFGGKYVNLGGVDFILEGGANAPTNTLAFIDPSSWVFVMNSGMFNVTWDDAPDLVASKRATVEYWAQLICKAPWKNAKLTGVTV